MSTVLVQQHGPVCVSHTSRWLHSCTLYITHPSCSKIFPGHFQRLSGSVVLSIVQESKSRLHPRHKTHLAPSSRLQNPVLFVQPLVEHCIRYESAQRPYLHINPHSTQEVLLTKPADSQQTLCCPNPIYTAPQCPRAKFLLYHNTTNWNSQLFLIHQGMGFCDRSKPRVCSHPASPLPLLCVGWNLRPDKCNFHADVH